MNNALGLVGIAKKAGKLAIGEESCGIAVRDHRAKAIFTASDAAERAKNWASSSGIVYFDLDETKEELGALLGRASCAVFVLSDIGIAAAVAEKLSVQTGKYTDACEMLKAQEARAKKRKQKKLSRKG